MMKSIDRRIRRFEEKYGLGTVETEFSRRLCERIEEGRRRLGEARERGEWSGSVGNDGGENRAGLKGIPGLSGMTGMGGMPGVGGLGGLSAMRQFTPSRNYSINADPQGGSTNGFLTLWNNPRLDTRLAHLATGKRVAVGFSGNRYFHPFVWDAIHMFELDYDEQGRVSHAWELG
jgi:hypothetical protein